MGGSSGRKGLVGGQPWSENLDGSLVWKVQNREKCESGGGANHTNDRNWVMAGPAV